MASDITPALSKDVSFTDKIQVVDDALKSRSASQKDIKIKWAAVLKVLTSYDQKAPARRGDAVAAANLVSNINIYKPLDARLEDKQKVRTARLVRYELNGLLNSPKRRTAMEDKYPGITDWCDDLNSLYELTEEPREIDEPATKTARAEVQVAVDAYIEALEAYDETVESVANVKEYIAVVKDVAEISAIAEGAQQR